MTIDPDHLQIFSFVLIVWGITEMATAISELFVIRDKYDRSKQVEARRMFEKFRREIRIIFSIFCVFSLILMST
jgi:hypothetical protein